MEVSMHTWRAARMLAGRSRAGLPALVMAAAMLGLAGVPAAGADAVDSPPAPPAGRLLPGGTNLSKYLCVFGPQAKPRLGAAGCLQVVFLRVPRSTVDPVVVHVFDPGSGAGPELVAGNSVPTTTVFTVHGGAGAYTDAAVRAVWPPATQAGEKLAAYTSGAEVRRTWVTLGSFPVEQGEGCGEDVYFRVTALGATGSSTNLFRLAVSPATVDAFTYALSANLTTGMCFYVDIPAGAGAVIEHNFDMDWRSVCQLGEVRLVSSHNGLWVENRVSLPPAMQGRRLPYRVSRRWGGYNNVSVYVTDEAGQPLPIHFAATAAGRTAAGGDAPAVP